MRYLDSGARNPAAALGSWLEVVLQDADVTEVRWQSGFYTADGLGFLVPTIERIRDENGTVAALVGSNNGDTLRADLEQLIPLIGIPRARALLGVVSFAGAFFHPKAYHLKRRDGSEAAYIGSANLTSAGVGSLHVEAGVVLDTRDGDDPGELERIRNAVDAWFAERRPGLTVVDGYAVIEQLTADGVLAEAPSARAINESRGGATHPGRPRLQPLIRVPRLARTPVERTRQHVGNVAVVPNRTSLPRAGLPTYLRFDPATQTPTVGVNALTGTPLPGGAAGLVLRLNRDSARHFGKHAGTANVSIPVNTLSTLRFGLYRKTYERPRAEFSLRTRYVGAERAFEVEKLETNVMAYGFLEHETGHGDVRMLIPAAIRTLAARAQQADLPVPTDGDVAFLEWPTEATPEFRMTFLERGSPLYLRAQVLFDAAATSGELVGDGACWLPFGVSPSW